MKNKHYLLAGGIAACAVGAAALLPGESIRSADHSDPPSRTSPMADETPDRAADIADIYSWADDTNLNMVVTFAGPADTASPATYDPDVLYRVFLSTDGDALNTENVINVRFGKDGAGNNGIQIQGVPGAGTITGPVNQDLTSGGARARAGLFDDPFFFDLQGFMETVDTGNLSISNERDFFANANVTAFVIQVPLANINPTGALTVWAETRRFGGQL